ncbi:pimeloyl-ACP methyl ester carboxylesterase [Naumannella cuiyingiana]|uniref:Pimeloyl-ACP methyl ester carboxylesterase n=1 Tax=Naumannella cuiyingiana TaxID=1347891 RepID=A0A7Z0D820_9ACTN|nr:pimeloyl-ACP methyl ester carboxylesterase [Naumannella cuiyingiana]
MPSSPAPRLKRRFSRWAAALIIVVVLVAALAYLIKDPSPVGYWRSAAGQDAYRAAYAEAMTKLPAPDAILDIRTDYGIVRVYRFDARSGGQQTPVVLVPGIRSGTPMWQANLPLLQRERTVFALDALGDAGLSIQDRPIRTPQDQANWLDQTLAGLGIERAHVVGHSFGGWAAANFAARFPRRIASLSLLEPVYVWEGLPASTIAKSIPAALPFLPKAWRDAMLADFGGATTSDLDDPVARMIDAGMANYRSALPAQPELITGEQLSGLPVYLALAPRSVMHDAQSVADKAKASTPGIEVQIWPDTSHSLPMEVPGPLNDRLLAFMSAHDQR